MKHLLIAFVFLTVSESVFAECHLDGQVYEEGARVGAYVCRGGQWV